MTRDTVTIARQPRGKGPRGRVAKRLKRQAAARHLEQNAYYRQARDYPT